MHSTSQNVVSSFWAQLAGLKIDARTEPHYLKWLRYYWDFCVKAGREPQDVSSLEPFIDKLSQKGQGAGSSCTGWVKRFAEFHQDKASAAMSSETARAFLTDLAFGGKVVASTQN